LIEFKKFQNKRKWKKDDLSKIVQSALLDIKYEDKKKYLSDRM